MKGPQGPFFLGKGGRMSKFVRPSDFEDMMRPLARAAMDQNWQLKWTANGHVKWLPPKGPPVVTSVTNAAFNPNISKLRAGGLKMEGIRDLEKEEKPKEQEEPKTTAEVAPPTTPPPKEKKRMLPRGSVQSAVLDFFQKSGEPGKTYSLDDVVTHVRGAVPGVSREVISTTCSQNAAAGRLVRMGKGMYRFAHQDRRAADKQELTPEEQQMLQEDEKVLDNFMNALAELQAWAARMRQRSIQFNKMRKLLDGLKLE